MNNFSIIIIYWQRLTLRLYLILIILHRRRLSIQTCSYETPLEHCSRGSFSSHKTISVSTVFNWSCSADTLAFLYKWNGQLTCNRHPVTHKLHRPNLAFIWNRPAELTVWTKKWWIYHCLYCWIAGSVACSHNNICRLLASIVSGNGVEGCPGLLPILTLTPTLTLSLTLTWDIPGHPMSIHEP